MSRMGMIEMDRHGVWRSVVLFGFPIAEWRMPLGRVAPLPESISGRLDIKALKG